MRSRCVATTRRKSTGIGSVPPTGTTTFSWSTRRNETCAAAGRSPISSRKSVPPSAARISPLRSSVAPEYAPRRAPNSSDSTRCSGSAPQLTATKLPLRPESVWTARATTSFPDPVSPRMTIGTVAPATRAIESNASACARTKVASSGSGGERPLRLWEAATLWIGVTASRNRSSDWPHSNRSPSASVDRATRWPRRKVPFFEPRSSRIHLPWIRESRACLDDIHPSGMVTAR